MIYDILHMIYDIFISSICISAVQYPPSTSLQEGVATIYDPPELPDLFRALSKVRLFPNRDLAI